ncbi:MAG: GPW/gp25 family protein [Candidatus Pristimantibacillus sp.]
MYVVEAAKDYIDFNPSGLTEIIQNIKTIITTVKGSVPFNRAFGLDNAALDEPPMVAEALMTPVIIEAIETYETRVVVESVAYKHDEQGSMSPLVTFSLAEGVKIE